MRERPTTTVEMRERVTRPMTAIVLDREESDPTHGCWRFEGERDWWLGEIRFVA